MHTKHVPRNPSLYKAYAGFEWIGMNLNSPTLRHRLPRDTAAILNAEKVLGRVLIKSTAQNLNPALESNQD